MKKIDTKGFIGLTKVDDLYKQAGIDPAAERLYLDKKGDLDIPLSPDEHIVLRGNETIVAGDAGQDNGNNPVEIKFNDQNQSFDDAKTNHDVLCKLDAELEQALLFVDVRVADTQITTGTKLVLQDGDSFFTIPVGKEGGDKIDIEACGKHGRKPPRGQKLYLVRIDGEYRVVSEEKITGEELLQLVDKNYTEYSLDQKLHDGRFKKIAEDETVDLCEPGIERFITVPKQQQQGTLRKSSPSVA